MIQTHNNVCEKILYKKDGVLTKTPKRKFATLDLAVIEAKRLNMNEKQIHKAVAYKCATCGLYHVGKNNTLITDKYLRKLKKQYV